MFALVGWLYLSAYDFMARCISRGHGRIMFGLTNEGLILFEFNIMSLLEINLVHNWRKLLMHL